MKFETSKSSVWLEHEDSQKMYKSWKKYKGEAPTVYYDKIKACLKALKVKKITDLGNSSEALRHDHILSILHHNAKSEHSLIVSNYAWSSYGTDIEKTNNERLNLAGLYSYELDQIAELKALPKNTIIYRVKHENKKKNYYTYFYLLDKEVCKINLRCFGFKYGILDENPYHHFYETLGKKLKDDEDYFKERDL